MLVGIWEKELHKSLPPEGRDWGMKEERSAGRRRVTIPTREPPPHLPQPDGAGRGRGQAGAGGGEGPGGLATPSAQSMTFQPPAPDSARRLLRSPRSTSQSRPARPAPRPAKAAARPARLTCPRAGPAPPRGRPGSPPRGRPPSEPASARAPRLTGSCG